MYRAKVETISGTKIFAGGKWLQCIGNKNVNVGDYIWTDGRCVYGHNQQPQQPLVITLPNEDEAIPIVIDRKTYIFHKNKLKYLNTLSTTNQQIDYSLMINDTKGHTFIYEHPVKNWKFIRDNIAGYTKILAVNIDKSGNKFCIILQDLGAIVAESSFVGAPYYFIEDDYNYDREIYIKLFKNDEIFKTISLNKWLLEGSRDLPTSAHIQYGVVLYSYVELQFAVENAFIENETSWHFSVYVWATQNFSHHVIDPTTNPPTYSEEGSLEYHKHYTHFYVQSNNEYILHKQKTAIYRHETFINTNEYPDIERVKIPLDYGCYYTVARCSSPHGEEYMDYNFTLFNPDGTKIMSLVTMISYQFLIAKITDGYLFASQHVFLTENQSQLEVLGTDDASPAGIYLYKDGNLQKLVEGKCINQRLRPMKNFRKWQNRIREFTLNQ